MSLKITLVSGEKKWIMSIKNKTSTGASTNPENFTLNTTWITTCTRTAWSINQFVSTTMFQTCRVDPGKIFKKSRKTITEVWIVQFKMYKLSIITGNYSVQSIRWGPRSYVYLTVDNVMHSKVYSSIDLRRKTNENCQNTESMIK